MSDITTYATNPMTLGLWDTESLEVLLIGVSEEGLLAEEGMKSTTMNYLCLPLRHIPLMIQHLFLSLQPMGKDDKRAKVETLSLK